MPRDYPAARNAAITVGVGPTNVANAQNRTVIYIKNTSPAAQTITVVLGDFAINAGIILAVGDVYYDSDGDRYQCWRGPIICYGADAAAAISLHEH